LLAVAEEPLDPANQSLADALKASFWVLKVLMAFVVVLFLFSNFFVVAEQKEVVVLLRFGKVVDAYRQGLHPAFPYPIDKKISVPAFLQTAEVDAFWLTIQDRDKGADLSDLAARGSGLDPAVDGALLTGDRGLMHLLLQVQYQISQAELFVRNAQSADALLQSVVQNAAVAEAARRTADVLWKDPGSVAQAIRGRAQAVLDRMETGILLKEVTASRSYFPLQVKDQVLAVSSAESQARTTIQKALEEKQEKLNGAAGEAWQVLAEKIEQLDQVAEDEERDARIAEIKDIIEKEADGEAAERIQAARSESDRIEADTRARVRTFEALLEEHRRSPELLRQRLLISTLKDIYAEPGVTKWFLPAGVKQIVLWLGKDPQETLDAQHREAEARAKGVTK
jgi:membrane protease subunit HflK